MKKDSVDGGMILDPACGECALLKAAEKECGSQYKYYGIDVDKEVVFRNAKGRMRVCRGRVVGG